MFQVLTKILKRTKFTFRVCTLFILCLVLLPKLRHQTLLGNEVNEQVERRTNKLQGMWKKSSFQNLNKNNIWEEFSWHKNGDMYLIYDGLGGMALHSQPDDYIAFFSEQNKANQKYCVDSLKVYQENYVYFAKYKIIKDTLFHYKITHTNSSEVGTTAKRRFTFIGKSCDTLLLEPIEFSNPARIVFIRVK